MALFSTQRLSRAERAGNERDALVKFHVRTDLGRLANDDAGAVIDKKMGTNLRAGVNIYSCAAVCPLGHDARN